MAGRTSQCLKNVAVKGVNNVYFCL